MQTIMAAFRGPLDGFGGKKIDQLLDYATGIDGLPKSDVLKFYLEDRISVVVRPSGTEPKMKLYISVSAKDEGSARAVEKQLVADLEKFLG